MNENTTLEAEARVIRVHETHRDEFDTKIDKANRRLARHGIDGHFEATLVNTVAVEHRDGSVEYFYEYTLNSPSFEYAGWEFLATTDILDGGTLLRLAPGKSMPEGYVRPDAHTCEHCNVARPRAKSYLLRNVETGEIKQVGSSCLSLFLGVEPKGLWALAFVDDLDEYRTAGDGTPWSPSRWTIERVVRMSYAVTDGGKGFVSKAQAQQWEGKHASAGQVETVLTFRPRPRTSEEFKAWIAQMEADAEAVDAETIAEIIAYADTLSGDYGENMRVLTNSSVVEHRHLGLLVSLVGVWYRGKVRQAEEEAERKASLNEWLPAQVKDRLRDLELLITDIREYDGDFDVRTKINFRDAEGRTLQWWASGSKDDLEVGATVKLTGTVKKLDTYQDRKITQLTRCTYSVL